MSYDDAAFREKLSVAMLPPSLQGDRMVNMKGLDGKISPVLVRTPGTLSPASSRRGSGGGRRASAASSQRSSGSNPGNNYPEKGKFSRRRSSGSQTAASSTYPENGIRKFKTKLFFVQLRIQLQMKNKTIILEKLKILFV